MLFSDLASIDLTEEWQVTPVTNANIFRFQYLGNTGYSYVVVAQAQLVDDGLELFGTFRFNLQGQSADLSILPVPGFMDATERCLAVRGIGFSGRKSTKSLTLKIEATTMILNPIGNTTKEVVTPFLQSDAVNRQMVAANPDRNGGTIFNKGTKALWVGFGVNAEKTSVQKILPGGQMDIPGGFTGVINGIFDAADTPTSSSSPIGRAIVVEMVAA